MAGLMGFLKAVTRVYESATKTVDLWDYWVYLWVDYSVASTGGLRFIVSRYCYVNSNYH